MSDLIGELFSKNEAKMPLLIQQQYQQATTLFDAAPNLSEKDEEDCNRYLDEFILSCLIDPTFPKFVQSVDERLAYLVKNEL